MNITKVIYTPERVIKVCISKTGKDEQQQLVSDLVRHAIVFFTIGLIDKPESAIEEVYKINKNKVKIFKNLVVLSFSLEELNQVEDCQITIDSLTIFLSSKKKIKIEFRRTFTFEEIFSTNDDLEINIPLLQQKRGQIESQRYLKKSSIKEKERSNIQTKKYFKNSYEKFKDIIEESKIGNLIKYKSKSFDHALKEFGISLLSRVLLTISHLNTLLQNDFKKDLNFFLKSNVLNLQKEACET